MDENMRRMLYEVSQFKDTFQSISTEFHKMVVGQEQVFHSMLSAFLAGGHILLEGLPGLAKTLSIQTMASILDVGFKRIQFTPDMLPADIRGTLIYNQAKSVFEVKQGPIFTNFVLADEINRAPAKVQSALLESMQERTVTLGDATYALPNPFFVMATQNPIEQEGTYPLPEAQLDRFYMKVLVSYPSFDEEKELVARMSGDERPSIRPVIQAAQLVEVQKFVSQVYTDEKIVEYIIRLVHATREPSMYGLDVELLRVGASPRSSINFLKASRIEALLDGRAYVIPEDVKAVAHAILRHRLVLSFEAEAENMTADNVVDEMLNRVEIP